MTAGSSHTGKTGNEEKGGRWSAAWTSRRAAKKAQDLKEALMDTDARPRRMGAAPHPVSELLDCPPEIGSALTACAQTIGFEAGQTIFRQAAACAGLYLVVQGQLQRRTERMETRITLGGARPGDLVELAAALGDRRHTYSLVAQTAGLLLLLPIEALHHAFEGYPPLRMHLLEELAREVSRGYDHCNRTWQGRTRRSIARAPAP